MSASNAQKAPPLPRMLWWIVCTLALMIAAKWAAAGEPGGLLAVSLYKAHLMSLGGWGGYWLDRTLFPYARPHTYLLDELTPLEADPDDAEPIQAEAGMAVSAAEHDYPLAMLRRAIVVAACLVCVGLGA